MRVQREQLRLVLCASCCWDPRFLSRRNLSNVAFSISRSLKTEAANRCLIPFHAGANDNIDHSVAVSIWSGFFRTGPPIGVLEEVSCGGRRKQLGTDLWPKVV